MASFIKQELRPCLVNGKKALFHIWEQRQETLLSGAEIKTVFGIIEDEKGQVVRVNPTSIQFLDNKIREYCFVMPAGSSPEEV